MSSYAYYATAGFFQLQLQWICSHTFIAMDVCERHPLYYGEHGEAYMQLVEYEHAVRRGTLARVDVDGLGSSEAQPGPCRSVNTAIRY